MIKRMNKMKKSKQGSILIIVVLILALAIIFISSAMMLTQATRGRLYENTLQSQARLTVTAASEVFLEALETQEINDNQMDALLNANGVGPAEDDAHKLKMVVANIPGMTEDTDNCTYMDVYYMDNTKKVAVVDFKTIIGDQTESVRVYLDITDVNPSNGGRFKNQIDVGGATSGEKNLRFLYGEGLMNPALDSSAITDNTILFRGTPGETASDSAFYSNMVFAEDPNGNPTYAAFGGGNAYHGDMIFLDNTYMSTYSSVTAMDGDFYFIGNTTHDEAMIYKNDAGWSSIGSDSTFVFAGRSIQNKDVDTANDTNSTICKVLKARTCYFVGVTDDKVMATNKNPNANAGENTSAYVYHVDNANYVTPIPTNYTNNVTAYKAYDYTSSGDNAFPDDVVEDVFLDLNPDGGTKTIPAGSTLTRDEYAADGSRVYPKDYYTDTALTVITNPVTKYYPEDKKVTGEDGTSKVVPDNRIIDMDHIDDLDSDGDRQIALAAGYYLIKPGTSTSDNSNLTPYVFCIDGSKAADYRFYFEADGTFQLNLVVFAVYKVQETPKPVLFILEPGAKIYMSGTNYNTSSALCCTGWLSMNRGCGAATGNTNNAIGYYVQNNSLTGEGGENQVWSTSHQTKDGSQIEYSKFYDGIHRPSIYIYGTGNNVFEYGDRSILEAYIGLYEGSEFCGLDGASTTCYFYGRVESEKYLMAHSDLHICMPYTPSPNVDSSDPDFKLAESKYKVNNIVYYNGDATATPTAVGG